MHSKPTYQPNDIITEKKFKIGDPLFKMKGCFETNCLRKNSYSTVNTNSLHLKSGKTKCSCGCTCCLLTGVILFTMGILLLIWSPNYILMNERRRMMPGLPPFEWWKDPPDKIKFRAHLFNITNSERFMSGEDAVLNVEEIGPIVYKEKLEHLNITFNKNGTLGFISKRSAIFLPEETDVDMNATMIVPNYAVLGMASFIHDQSFFMKLGFNMMLRTLGFSPFIKSTPYNILWNLTDPALVYSKQMYPDLVPFLNIGMLARVYEDFEDSSTVFIGPKYGDEQFFYVDNYRGSPYLTGDEKVCPDKITNSSEGTLYPQHITKESNLKYWRKTLCKVVDLHYERSLENFANQGVETYKFTMDENSYDRIPETENKTDCYKGKPELPSGLSDVSMCYNNVPMAVSFPHFLYGSEEVKKSVTGLRPNVSKHEAYVILEPTTGIPIESFARSQCNLVIRKLSGFHSDVQRFSGHTVPMFWLEYHQTGIPDYVSNLMFFMVKLVPKYQYYFVSLILVLGAVIIINNIRKYFIPRKTPKQKKNGNLKANAQYTFETEKFLKL